MPHSFEYIRQNGEERELLERTLPTTSPTASETVFLKRSET